MNESRIRRARLILSALAAVLLTSCGDATESRPGKSPTTLEHDLRQESQDLDRSPGALGAGEQRIAGLREKRTGDRRRLAELTASSAGLERPNRELGRQLARAHGNLAQAERSWNALDQQREQQADTVGDATALRAELEQATGKIAKLRAAREYLVEKIETCALQQQSSRAESMQQARHLALLGKLVRSRSAAVSQQQSQDRSMPAHGQPEPAIGISRHARLIPVATQTGEQPSSTRRERELDEARKKAEDLEQKYEALTKKLQDRETECAAIEKRVQTLTWANEVLVKELEAAYEARNAGNPGSLPEGIRGSYVVQQGESLSQVAKAFYGDPGRWRDLVEANEDRIPDPDMIEPGTIILIPE